MKPALSWDIGIPMLAKKPTVHMRAADSSLRPSARSLDAQPGGCLRGDRVRPEPHVRDAVGPQALPIRVFRDLGAANAWLGIEPDERIHGSDALRLVFSGLKAT